ncbi:MULTISPECIES: hypothetical protein [unclassified Microcoleus]
MLLAGSLAVIGKEKSSLKLENLVKPECDRSRGEDCRFLGRAAVFLAWRVPSFAISKNLL